MTFSLTAAGSWRQVHASRCIMGAERCVLPYYQDRPGFKPDAETCPAGLGNAGRFNAGTDMFNLDFFFFFLGGGGFPKSIVFSCPLRPRW